MPGVHSADCVVVSIDFAPMAQLQAEGRWDEAGRYLAAKARSLEARRR
jgi:aspartate racemase